MISGSRAAPAGSNQLRLQEEEEEQQHLQRWGLSMSANRKQIQYSFCVGCNTRREWACRCQQALREELVILKGIENQRLAAARMAFLCCMRFARCNTHRDGACRC